ncbi:MAG: hypothetical protein Q8P67_16070, partial [archaeon]|nr:hypothetical protein [archaeon]
MSSSRGVPATETWLMATGGDGQYIDKLQGETERKRLLGALQKSIKDLVRIGFDREGPFTEQDGGVEEFCRAAMECLSHRVKDTLKDSGLVLPLVVFDQIAISTQKGGSGKKKGGVFDNIRSFSVDDFSAKLRQQQPDAAASLARERLSRGDVSGANLAVLRFFWKLLNERLFSHALEAYLSEKPFLERTYAQSSLLTDYESRMLILSILPTLDQLAFAIDTAFDPHSDPHSSPTPSSSAYDKAFPAATVSLSAPSTPQPSSARARRKRRPKKVATIDSEVQQIKCEACGEPLRSGWKLCPSCGEVCAPIVVSQPPSSIAPALPLDSSGPILDPDPLASSPPSLLSRIVGIGAQPSSPLSASPASSGLTSSSLIVAAEPDGAPPVDAPTVIPNSPNLPAEHLLLTDSCLPTLGNLSSDSNPTAITAVATSDLLSPPPISQPISIPLPPVPSAAPPSLPLPSSSLFPSLSPPQPSSPTNLSPPLSASSPSSP